jgi:adenosylcobyric acid synthase
VRFNPVLLKPGSDRTSQLVVRGRVSGTVSARDYITHRDRLADVVADEFAWPTCSEPSQCCIPTTRR